MSAVLPRSAMRRVTCTELRELAAAYRPALDVRRRAVRA